MSASVVRSFSIRGHVTVLVACCALGGLFVTAGAGFIQKRIETASNDLHENRVALIEFEYLARGVSEWFVTTDLVLQGDYDRIDTAVQQADAILRRSEELTEARLLDEHTELLAQLGAAVRTTQELLVRAANPRTLGSPSQRWEVSQAIDEVSAPIVERLEDVRESIQAQAETTRTLLVERRKLLRGGALIAIPLYLLVVIWVWRWTWRTLVQPLQALTKETVAAMENGNQLQFAAGGPREVRVLSKHLATLISSLELARDEMHTEAVETEALLQSVPAVLIGVGPGGEVVRWNAAASRSFGLLPSQAIGRSLRDCSLPWADKRLNDRICDHLGLSETRTINDVIFHDGRGTSRILNVTITPIDYGSTGSGFLFLGMEVTEQRGLEKQLRHAQKLESVGQLAAGVAHEINTPIQYVGHSVHFLRDAFTDLDIVLGRYRDLRDAVAAGSEEPADHLQRIEEAEEEAEIELLAEEVPSAIDRAIEGIQRVSAIVVAMKQFAHPGGKEMAPADLNEALKTTITVAKNEYRYVADLVTDFEDIPLVVCNQGDLNQVFLNLIVNAAHAIEDRVAGTEQRGTITVRTRSKGETVQIEIEDTGSGIPNDVAERIFDPFFTTKAVGKGTGQGLSIVHALVTEKHGGMIRFRTKVGEGTTFIITLPVRRATDRKVAA